VPVRGQVEQPAAVEAVHPVGAPAARRATPGSLRRVGGGGDRVRVGLDRVDHQAGRQQRAWVGTGHRWRSPRLGARRQRRPSTQPATEPFFHAESHIAALYALEAEVQGRPPGARRAARRRRSRLLVLDLFAWLEARLARVPGRGDTADAIRCALNGREGLTRFLDDGRIDLDTDTVERAIRPVVLGRKNALFAGSNEGGEDWAAVASLVETRKLNGVDPQRHLAELLARLVDGWPQSRIDEPMPWCWTAA